MGTKLAPRAGALLVLLAALVAGAGAAPAGAGDVPVSGTDESSTPFTSRTACLRWVRKYT